jgi:hypothetical protein
MNFATTVGLWNDRITISGSGDYQNGMSQVNLTLLQGLDPYVGGLNTIVQLNDPTVPIPVQAFYRSGYAAVHQVSVFRLQSLSVRAALPDVYAHRFFRAETMSVALMGSNLHLWTNYSGVDPNVTSSIYGNAVTDSGVLPQPRTWGLNVMLTY